MATEESKSKTAYYEGLDLGALNRLNRDVTASRLNTSAGAVSILGTIFDEVYKTLQITKKQEDILQTKS